MTINHTNILLRHNCIAIPSADDVAGTEGLATVMMNLSYYGYALSMEGYKAVSKLGPVALANWWMEVEKELKNITGADRKIGDFVVYKNFPTEVLNKTESEYWIPQILMYWGFPKEFFTEEVQPRPKMKGQPRVTVLKKANKNTLKEIFTSYLKSPARWKRQELEDVWFLSESFPVDFAKIGFKENLINLATYMINNDRKINISTATDVLRLAVGLSGGDASLREKSELISFKKPVRRYLLSLLENCPNLREDMARRPELFKRLVHQLHPGDYKRRFPKVCGAATELYKGELLTFNSDVERLIMETDVGALHLLSTRPGEFRRRLVHMIDTFDTKAVKAFTSKEVLDKLTTAQLVTLRSHLESVNDRYYRTFPPKGNWTKMQIGEARYVDDKHVKTISKAIGKIVVNRVPKVKVLDPATKMIKLPSNDGEVSPYARGTVFPIPEEVDFIRTASYWQNTKGGVTWFDNGWNFFDSNWKSVGSCCWSAAAFPVRGWNQKAIDSGAVFSGDPVNTTEMKGRAAQLIDLYPSRLLKQGVRYAVWNILCYSKISFSQADEVFAALQWGKDAQSGKLFEPSRCQLQFPLKGDSMTKYVCVIDLKTREMIYIDANLRGQVQSADRNGPLLEKNMPAFMEYINSLPSVHDLFRDSVDKKNGESQVLYSDKDVELKGEQAYVFRQENKDNKFKSLDLNSLLT